MTTPINPDQRTLIVLNMPKIAAMAGQCDRPQQVLDFIDFIWKLHYGEVLR